MAGLASQPRRTGNITSPTENMSANNTARLFLGVNQPVWMRGGQGGGGGGGGGGGDGGRGGRGVGGAQASGMAPPRAIAPATRLQQQQNRQNSIAGAAGCESVQYAGPPVLSGQPVLPGQGQGQPTLSGQSQPTLPGLSQPTFSRRSTFTGLPTLPGQALYLPPQAASRTANLPSPAPSDEGSAMPKAAQHVWQQGPMQNTSPAVGGANPRAPESAGGAPVVLKSSVQVFDITLYGWVDKMTTYMRSRGGHVTGQLATRLRLLKEACETNDILYLALNQISCVVAVDVNSLPTAVVAHPNFLPGFETLHKLLKEHKLAQTGFQEFFATFPAPLAVLQTIPPYQQALDNAIDVIFRLAIMYPNLVNGVVTYQRPPMIGDMIDRLRITSPGLQRIVCSAIARGVFGVNANADEKDELILKLDKAFKRYQKDFQTGQKLTQMIMNVVHERHFPILQSIYNELAARRNREMQANPQAYLPAAQMQTRPSIRIGGSGMAQLSNFSQQPIGPQHFLNMPHVVHGQYMHILQHASQLQQAQPLPAHPRQLQSPIALQQGIIPSKSTHFYARPGIGAPEVHPPCPDKFALHEAYLREPNPQVTSADNLHGQPMYRFVERLALPVQSFFNAKLIQQWSFELSDADFNALAPDTSAPNSTSLIRLMSESTKTYRLRRAKVSSNSSAHTTENHWVTAETDWPHDVYWTCNELRLLPQRKLYNGRDLPIDITRSLQPGVNTIRAFSNRRQDADPDTHSNPARAIAVEVVGAAYLDTIVTSINSRVLEAEVSKKEVVGMLKGHASSPTFPNENEEDSDDDIMVTNNTLTISLLDPFHGGRSWDIPVRGRGCQHRDCWDLATFLQTRLQTRQSNGEENANTEPSGVDVWKCPICAGDARPGELVVDGWLVAVKEELLAREGGMEGVQAIVVDDKGVWNVKEAAGGRGGGGDAAAGKQASATPVKKLEVIDLDDSDDD